MDISGPRPSKTPPNSTRRHPERHKKSETVAGEGRKSAKFWAPHPSVPHPLGPHPSIPHPLGPHSGAPQSGALKGVCSSMHVFHLVFLLLFFFSKKKAKRLTPRGRFGQSRPIKVGQSRFGQSRSNKGGQSRSNFSGQSPFGQSRNWPKSANKDGQSGIGQSRSQPELRHRPHHCSALLN